MNAFLQRVRGTWWRLWCPYLETKMMNKWGMPLFSRKHCADLSIFIESFESMSLGWINVRRKKILCTFSLGPSMNLYLEQTWQAILRNNSYLCLTSGLLMIFSCSQFRVWLKAGILFGWAASRSSSTPIGRYILQCLESTQEPGSLYRSKKHFY